MYYNNSVLDVNNVIITNIKYQYKVHIFKVPTQLIFYCTMYNSN